MDFGCDLDNFNDLGWVFLMILMISPIWGRIGVGAFGDFADLNRFGNDVVADFIDLGDSGRNLAVFLLIWDRFGR